ncbi:uncharacterized protein F4822DRAFT_435924 [Hypoxylon trugodes]|uniref:uncharacterized protein n=1 Tax=Hypoxylon trugodes TaxID=326681 RepID=UPI00219E0075|nr:uncharacterized protein F4822DRAFT_435924 [Hypoxylon trugodes]KAI1394272.1 hypothetical protein F4822DRAFT_435924 [Hypoxylon trugodes]
MVGSGLLPLPLTLWTNQVRSSNSSVRKRRYIQTSATIRSISHHHDSSLPSGLGLHVVHQPEFASLDIIFVHGLGGHSQRTWSKNHDPSLYWPKLWLPSEPGIDKARILTFGYNAAWHGATKSIANITDFAKELLFEMRFSRDDSGADLKIGTNPIIFIVHSMGGLVVKKAYLLGLHDENYKDVTRSISAIMFLSTPHRGTNLATILNRVLAASFQSSKNFISDLNKSSPAIEELNEQFRHFSLGLSIWSFYETMATSIGFKKIMILEKDSSVLGYPAEISRPLQADHHDVCKYSSPTDPNYISVRNAIASLAAHFGSTKTQEDNPIHPETPANLQGLFRDCLDSEDDYSALIRCLAPGTCEWFVKEPEFISWMELTSDSQVLWFNAPPGTGKSVLSAFLISHLRKLGCRCQFFLFKYSDGKKRSVAGALLSLASQLVQNMPEFAASLNGSSPESLGLNSEDIALIWRNLFKDRLFEMRTLQPIYWIIDGLDECDSPNTFLECLAAFHNTQIPIRILILSRDRKPISDSFNRLSDIISVSRMDQTCGAHYQRDIGLFIKWRLKHMRGSDEFRRRLVQTIMERSGLNFLWTKLVLDEVMECHTEDRIREVLEEVPGGNLVNSTRNFNIELIRALIDLEEMSEALKPEFQETCYMRVEENGRVNILHHTARDYFTNSLQSRFYIDLAETHGRFLMKTITTLEDPELRWRLVHDEHGLQSSEPFVFYSAVNWPFHLDQCYYNTPECLNLLKRVFGSPVVLTWIYVLALLRQLDVLINAAGIISSVARNMKTGEISSTLAHPDVLVFEFLNNWAIDLIKIAEKFASNLVANPGAIYEIVPALCPTKSMMYRQFSHSTHIKVHGTAGTGWSDHLHRLSLPKDIQAWEIICVGKYLVVLGSTGIVHVWDTSGSADVVAMAHGEVVTAMATNRVGTKIVTYGMKSTKIWALPSGDLLNSTANPPFTKALAIAFYDNVIRQVKHDTLEEGWQVLNPNVPKDTRKISGAIVSAPVCVEFNSDNTQVAVSYRGAPLSVWRLRDGRCINISKRATTPRDKASRPSSNWFSVNRFTWNPTSGHILGIYKDGRVFKWHPMTDENVEADVRWAADEIAASPNGKLFATSSSDGSVRIWDFMQFNVIYELSLDDLVTRLAFSPDSRRLYDLRGGSINVWEPNSLSYCLEPRDDTKGKDQSSSSSGFPGARTGRHEAVTAFCRAPGDTKYCVGYEDGVVSLHKKGNTEVIEVAHFHNSLPVAHITWNQDGSYVAAADLAGDIQVKSLDDSIGQGLLVSSLPSPRLSLDTYNIEGIVLRPDGQELLIVTKGKCSIFSTTHGTIRITFMLYGDDCNRRWLCHPTRLDIILGYGALDVRAYTWAELRNIYWMSYNPKVRKPSQPKTAYDKLPFTYSGDVTLEAMDAIPTRDGNNVLLCVQKTEDKGYPVDDFMVVSTFNLTTLDHMTNPFNYLDIFRLPQEVSARVQKPLGVIYGSEIVFLDHDFWLCSWSLNVDVYTAESYRRHYFIPRNWIGQASLDQCSLADDGSLFWPTDNRIVVIECNLDDTRLGSVF